MFRLLGLTIAASLLATTLAVPQQACLPQSLFLKSGDAELPTIDLGYVHDTLTLCAHQNTIEPRGERSLGCWTVNPTTGVLGQSAARTIPGVGRRTEPDAQGCINGYCVPPVPAEAPRPIFATSTDGAHVAIVAGGLLYVFATAGKTKVAEIELAKADAASETNVSNEPTGLIYNGDTLFVIGSDAGPFIGAWVFKQDGSRARWVRAPNEDVAFNLFNGGYGILGRDKVAFADAGTQNMTIVSGANTARQNIARGVSSAPCSKEEFESWTLGEDAKPGACKRVLDAKFAPYAEISLAQLPSGDIVAALGGDARGEIAIFSRAGLREIRRLKLTRCR